MALKTTHNRDPERLPNVTFLVECEWERRPQLRLGQLLLNCFQDPKELYNIEDYDLIDRMKQFYTGKLNFENSDVNNDIMKNHAKQKLIHYFKMIMTQSGLKWSDRNAEEIGSIVDGIIDTAVDEAKNSVVKPPPPPSSLSKEK